MYFGTAPYPSTQIDILSDFTHNIVFSDVINRVNGHTFLTYVYA